MELPSSGQAVLGRCRCQLPKCTRHARRDSRRTLLTSSGQRGCGEEEYRFGKSRGGARLAMVWFHQTRQVRQPRLERSSEHSEVSAAVGASSQLGSRKLYRTEVVKDYREDDSYLIILKKWSGVAGGAANATRPFHWTR